MFEIKIFCHCGTKYKFDVEPINGRMPGPVQCPVCRTDGTEEGNRLILARISPPEAPVIPVPVSAPSAHPSLPAAPRISIPGNGSGAAISIPNISLPKPAQAPPANPAIVIPVATPAPVAPSVTTAPGPMPVRPSAVAVPKPAPHPPLPRSSRDVLQAPQPPANPLVPSPNAGGAIRLGTAPPEQHAPATPAAHQAPPPVPIAPMAIAAPPARPAPISAAAMKPAPAQSGGFSLSRGYVGAIIAGLIIFLPWFLLLLLKQRGLGIVAWGLGGFIGWLTKVFARGTHPKLGVTAAITTSLVILGGSLVAASSISSSLEEEMVNTRYKNDMAHAKEAVQAAKSDADIKAFLAKIYSEEGLKIQPSDIENDQVADFKTKDLPKYKLMADGKMTKKQFRERQIAEIGGDFTFTVVFVGMFSIFSIIWLFCGIGTAYRVAAGASK